MKLIDILNAANEAYPDQFLENYYDKETGEKKNLESNDDTLAKFIVIEIIETYDSSSSDEEQLEEVYRVLNRGIDDLGSVVDYLHDRLYLKRTT